MRRIQVRIDHEIKNLEWVSDNNPELLKFEEREYDDPRFERHSRLKTLLRICAKISPFNEDPVIIKILGQMLPPQFGIELFKKHLSNGMHPMIVFECKEKDCGIQFEPADLKDGNCPKCGKKNYVLME